MKILSITAQKPHSTGSGTYMTELVRAFSRMGHGQAVVCGIFPSDSINFPDGVACYPVFFSETDAPGKSAEASVALFAPCKTKPGAGSIKTLPFPVVGMSDIMPYESTRYCDLTPDMINLFEEAFIDAVSRAVRDLDPDLIICHHLFLLTAMVKKHFPERRIAGISHGTDLRQMINCPHLAELVRPQIRRLDMALALHAEQAGDINRIFGMDDEKVQVIGSGYNDRLFNTEGRLPREAGSAVRITYAGKISRPKGVPELLAALERLAGDDDVPPFALTMAGGCQDEALNSRMDELPAWADWLGQIPQPALAELLRRTDIFVLPSYFEGLPLVLIEAMSAGAVPVSTDLPGIKGWIDANVGRPNVVYVPMPDMKSIDEPSDSGRAAFTDDLCSILRETITRIYSGRGEAPADSPDCGGQRRKLAPGADILPDTSAITWDGLASRLLSLQVSAR